jgi:hypothetical protein
VISIGIDPGKQGALCRISYDGDIEIVPIPLLTAAVVRGKKRGRDEYDLAEIVVLLAEWRGVEATPTLVTVEKSQPIPPGVKAGSIANYQRGVMRGWEWMLAALGVPYQLVAPVTWMKAMHAGTPGADTKQRSILAAQRLFPAVSLRRSERSKKPDHNFCEALLLAEYGRRTGAP